MSCGDERPCSRCVDRGIGHLCCDGERKPRPTSSSAPKRAKIEETSFRAKSFADSARMYYTMNGSPMLPFAPQPMSNPPPHFAPPISAQMHTSQPNPYAQAYYWSEQSQTTDYGYHQANNAASENGDMSLQAPMSYMRPNPYARSRSMPGFGSHDAPVYSQNGPVLPAADPQQYAPVHYATTAYHTPSDISVSHTVADEASYNQSYSSPADLSDAPEEHQLHYDNQYYSQAHYVRQLAARSASPAPSGYSLPEATVSSLDTVFAPQRPGSYPESQTKYYKQSAYVPDTESGLHAAYVGPVATTSSSDRYSYSSHEWQGNSMLESALQAPSY
jgi:hypothetical protein